MFGLSYDCHLIWPSIRKTLDLGGKGGKPSGATKMCSMRTENFLVIGEVEKINGVLYKLLRLVGSFLVIGEEEKIICAVWCPLD